MTNKNEFMQEMVDNGLRSNKKMIGVVAENIKPHAIRLAVLVPGVVRNTWSARLLRANDNLARLYKQRRVFVLGITSEDPNSVYFNEDLQSSSEDKRLLSDNTIVEYNFARAQFSQYGLGTREDEKFVYVDKFETGVEISSFIATHIDVEKMMEDNTYAYRNEFKEAFEQLDYAKENNLEFRMPTNIPNRFIEEYSNQQGFVSQHIHFENINEKEFLTNLNRIIFVDEKDIITTIEETDELGVVTRHSYPDPFKFFSPEALGLLVESSVGKKRMGHAQYLKTWTNNPNIHIMNVSEFYKKLRFLPEAFAKHLQDRFYKIDIRKASTRIRLNNSSSISVPVFKTTINPTVETVIKDVQKEITNEDNSKIIGSKIEQIETQLLTFEDGLTMLLTPDFTVAQEVDLFVPEFDLNTDTIEIKDNQRTVVSKNATDGVIYFGDEVRNRFTNYFNETHGGYQFRANGNQKGMAIYVPKLKELIGVDIVSFEGSRKSEVLPFLKEDGLTFSVLNFTKEPKKLENQSDKVSRQSLINVIQNREQAEMMFDVSSGYWDEILKLDKNSLTSIIGAAEIDLNNTEDIDDLIFKLANGEDSDTSQFISANPELAIKSAAMRTKVLTLVSSIMKDFKNGHAFVPESYNAHMVVDPIGILEYMKDNVFGVVKGRVDEVVIVNGKVHHISEVNHGRKLQEVGIKPDSGLDVIKDKDGNYALAEGDCLAIRYPNLHRREIRKLSRNQFYDNKTKNTYSRVIKQQYFKGLFLFSMWDMNPEGMSGADYDGDKCSIINNSKIVDSFEQENVFLDYSNVVSPGQSEAELIEGCPFPGASNSIELSEVIKDEMLLPLVDKYELKIGGTKESTMKFGEIEFNDLAFLSENYDEFMTLIHPIMQYFILIDLKGNDIGKYTDLLTTVTATKSEVDGDINTTQVLLNELSTIAEYVKNSPSDLAQVSQDSLKLQESIEFLKREKAGFDNLQVYLASAVRWEIDAAKHGGAYRKHLPFLNVLDGIDVQQNPDVYKIINEMESKFDISLERLFINREKIEKESY